MKSFCDCVLSCVSVSARSCDNSRRKNSSVFTHEHAGQAVIPDHCLVTKGH